MNPVKFGILTLFAPRCILFAPRCILYLGGIILAVFLHPELQVPSVIVLHLWQHLEELLTALLRSAHHLQSLGHSVGGRRLQHRQVSSRREHLSIPQPTQQGRGVLTSPGQQHVSVGAEQLLGWSHGMGTSDTTVDHGALDSVPLHDFLSHIWSVGGNSSAARVECHSESP